MIDEIDGRIWAAHHHAFNDWVASAMGVIRVSLAELHRVQFSAPWHEEVRSKR
jgi:hypothetical protein